MDFGNNFPDEEVKKVCDMLEEFFEINKISDGMACQSMLMMFLYMFVRNDVSVERVNKILDYTKKAYKEEINKKTRR